MKKTLPLTHRAVMAVVLAAALLSLAGCKAASNAVSPGKKAESFLVFMQDNGGNSRIMRAGLDGSAPAELFNIQRPVSNESNLYTAHFAYDPAGDFIYMEYAGSLYAYSMKTKSAKGLVTLQNPAENLWISRDGKSLIAQYTPPPAEGARSATKYALIDTATGGKKDVTPADKAWDAFDFYNKLDYCYAVCDGVTYKGPGGASFSVAARKASGANRWPVLSLKTAKGKAADITDGSRRVLAARFSATGKRLLYITASPTAGNAAGILAYYDLKTGKSANISEGVRTEDIFNVAPAKDGIFYAAQVQGEVPAGMYFDFGPKPKIVATPAHSPRLLLESK